MNANLVRRKVSKSIGIALTLMPMVLLYRQARAKTNTAMRAELEYQSAPKDGMQCTSCLEFIPGKTEKSAGACKVIPGDDEISPDGYCARWNTM